MASRRTHRESPHRETPHRETRALRGEQTERRRWRNCARPACRRHRRCSPPPADMRAGREPPCSVTDRRAMSRFIDGSAPLVDVSPLGASSVSASPVNEDAAGTFDTERDLELENIMARANQGMGGGVAGNRAGPNGHQAAGADEDIISESDLAADKMGDAGQQGTDPDRLSNERDTAVDTAPGGKPQPDASPVESFEMMDKDVRAAKELGKGNREGETPDPDADKSLVDEMSDPKDADASLASRNGI